MSFFLNITSRNDLCPCSLTKFENIFPDLVFSSISQSVASLRLIFINTSDMFSSLIASATDASIVGTWADTKPSQDDSKNAISW